MGSVGPVEPVGALRSQQGLQAVLQALPVEQAATPRLHRSVASEEPPVPVEPQGLQVQEPVSAQFLPVLPPQAEA